MKNIIVVGAGAAGLMAAVSAAQSGAKVTILEKMKRPGKKMLITGKGRCNLTNNTDITGLIKNMTGNGKFLYSAFQQFDTYDTVEFFEAAGMKTKVERGNRVFPESDKAADVVEVFTDKIAELDIDLLTEQTVTALKAENGVIAGVTAANGKEYAADAVIIAVGGASYPGTGSTGDGCKLAASMGHTIIPLQPSLVPLETEEDWVKDAQGLSLKNVRAELFADDKKIDEEFGEMIFTHFGVSGPIILSLSRMAAKHLAKQQEISLVINLKPALSPEKLDARLQRDFTEFSRKQLKNVLHELLPSKLIQIVMDLAYLDGEKPVHQITKEERLRLADVVQHLELIITKTRPLAEAIVTAGGVCIKEINPKTMESKKIRNLYFAGEVIDIDGYTGGFNIQAAFSTGRAAGINAAIEN